MALIFFVAPIVIFTVWFVRWYYNNVYVFNRRLRKFKSPPEVLFFGHALDFAAKDNLAVFSKYIKENGENVRVKIGPARQLLFTSDYKLIEFILINSKVLEKSQDYRNLKRWLGTGLLTGGGIKWKKNRRILTPTFHYQILETFIDIFEANAEVLVEKLKNIADKSSINIHQLAKFCTLDIICETAMGIKIYAQSKGHSSEYVNSVGEMCRILVERAFNPKKVLDFTYYFTDDYNKEQKALKILHDFSNNVIMTRKAALDKNIAESKQKKFFLDLLLEQENLTLDEIQEEVDTFMFAGHDTTASAISFALYNIANHQDIQDKILEEQNSILGKDFARTITMDDLKQMKYLDLVLKETLRLYPSVPYIAREITEEVSYDNEILPKGLTITMFIYGIHRNPKYFPHPEKFDPTRYETKDSKIPFAYIPFSAGSRNCIGQKFAMLAMKSVITKIVQNFKLLPANPHNELQLAAEAVLISKNGINIQLEKRIA